MLLLCVFSIKAQPTNQRVTLQCQSCTIESALIQLKTNYGIHFSYSSDVVDVKQRVTVHASQQPLTVVLDQLFRNKGISYKIIGDQVVLKKVPILSTPPVHSVKPSGAIKSITPPQYSHAKDSVVLEYKEPVRIEAPVLVVPSTPDTVQALRELDKVYVLEQEEMKKKYKKKKDSIQTIQVIEKLRLKESWKEAKLALSASYKHLRDSILFSKKDTSWVKDTIPYSDELVYDDFQLTGLYPWSTHGKASPYFVNGYSINILPGYNGGVRYLEVGLVGNCIKHYVEGIQLGSVFNIVQQQVLGVQFAGGLNVTGREVLGGQFSGVVNYAGGVVSGVQAAGIVNVANESMQGTQLAGLVNVNRRFMSGAQVGCINVTKRLHGVQIGCINVADSLKGVPIGFLSFVKNGYGRVELYASETMWLNLNYKTGVKAFYNILHMGYSAKDPNYQRWSFGYGLGTCIQIGRRGQLNVDAIALHINENEWFTNNINEQFKLNVLLGVGLTKRVYLYGGPSFNTLFSEYKTTEGTIGSDIVPDKGVVHTERFFVDNREIVNSYWIGWQAGIRF
ncbi:MAG: STN domain-containing protein [Cytophagaceae bacterium]|nr:STN domain-containing protein [Cytophagaceae bacterium]